MAIDRRDRQTDGLTDTVALHRRSPLEAEGVNDVVGSSEFVSGARVLCLRVLIVAVVLYIGRGRSYHEQVIAPGAARRYDPPPTDGSSRLAADLRPSADGSAVRTWLSCRQLACL